MAEETTTTKHIDEIEVRQKGIAETAAALAALGAAAAGTDEKVKRTSASWEQLKNRFVEGNQAANGAEKALTALQNAMTAGKAKGDDLAAVYAGIVNRFGATAVAASLTKDSLGALSVKLSDVNVSSEATRLLQAKQAAGLDEVRLKYDSVRREISEYGTELTRVKGILEAANVPEAERVLLLKQVEAALNPAVKAENAMTAALQKQREEQAKLMAGYRDQAALARSSAQGQAMWNTYAGVKEPSTSASSSAAVFQASFDEQDAAARATREQAVAIQALRDKFVPFQRVQREYLEDLRQIKSAGTDVFKTEDERAKALQRVKDRFAEHVTGVRASKQAVIEHTEAVRLQNYQLINFGQQLQDIGVSLAGGQNPFMVMVQQVPQMASAVGGVDKIGLAFRTLMTPMVLAAAGAASVGGAFFLIGKHAYDAHEQVRALRTSLDLMGQTNTSAGMLSGTANTTVLGAPVSRTDAAASVSQLSSNVNISAESMATAAAVARDLAVATGKTMPEATAILLNALEGGYEGLIKFNSAYRTLTPAQLEEIHNLQTQQRYTEATTLALTLMGQKMGDIAKNSTSQLRKDWESVKDAADGALDSMTLALGLREANPVERLDRAKDAMNRIGVTGSPDDRKRAQTELEEAQRALAAAKATADIDKEAVELQQKRIRSNITVEDLARGAAVGAVSPGERGAEAIRQRMEKESAGSEQRMKLEREYQLALQQTGIAHKDQINQMNLAADAQGRLADVQGKGIVQQMAAERQSKVAAALLQDATIDVAAYTAALEREDAAKIRGMQNGWSIKIAEEIKAAEELAEAWRKGDATAINRASIEKEAIALSKEFGYALDDARKKIELKNAALASPEVEKALTTLRQQVELQERLAVLEGTADTVGARKASIDAQMKAWQQQNPYGNADAQRSLLERQQQAGLKTQAYGLQAQMDPVIARKKALAELNDLEQQHILSEEDIARRRMEINIAYEQGEIDKLEATRTFAGGAEAAMRRYALDASNWATQGASLINKSLKSAEDGFAGFAKGTQTAGDAMRSFANVVLMEIQRMATAALLAQSVSPLMNSMFAGLGKLAGSMFGSSGSSDPLSSNFRGSSPDIPSTGSYNGPTPFPAYASGTDSTPTGLILVGENGPELMQQGGGNRIYTAEDTRRLLSGTNDNSYRAIAASPVNAAAAGGVVINIQDHRTSAGGEAGEGVSARDGGVGPDGRRIIEILVTDIVNKTLSSGKADKAMTANYGVQRKGIER